MQTGRNDFLPSKWKHRFPFAKLNLKKIYFLTKKKVKFPLNYNKWKPVNFRENFNFVLKVFQKFPISKGTEKFKILCVWKICEKYYHQKCQQSVKWWDFPFQTFSFLNILAKNYWIFLREKSSSNAPSTRNFRLKDCWSNTIVYG